MKVTIVLIVSVSIVMIVCSCSKSKDDAKPTSFIGKWTQSEIYGNDFWGGPAYWKAAAGDTKIEFTKDGKYFKKYNTDSMYSFIGTFKTLSDSTVEITQDKPVNPSYPSYILNYTFSNGGYMTWGIFGNEGLSKEKYRLSN